MKPAAKKCKLTPQMSPQSAATLLLEGWQAAKAELPPDNSQPTAWREGFNLWASRVGLPRCELPE